MLPSDEWLFQHFDKVTGYSNRRVFVIGQTDVVNVAIFGKTFVTKMTVFRMGSVAWHALSHNTAHSPKTVGNYQPWTFCTLLIFTNSRSFIRLPEQHFHFRFFHSSSVVVVVVSQILQNLSLLIAVRAKLLYNKQNCREEKKNTKMLSFADSRNCAKPVSTATSEAEQKKKGREHNARMQWIFDCVHFLIVVA